jgi:hypothetical protein
VIAAGGASAAVAWAVLAAVAGFVASHAVTAPSAGVRAAWRPAAGVAALAGAGAAWAGAPLAALGPTLVAGGLGLLAHRGLHRHGLRARGPLVASTLALGAAIVAVALAGGAAPLAAGAAGGVVALHGVARLFAVRALLVGPGGRWALWRATLVPLAVVAGGVAGSGASAWLVAAFGPGVLASAILGRGATPPPVRQVGRGELLAAIGFLILAGIGLVPR